MTKLLYPDNFPKPKEKVIKAVHEIQREVIKNNNIGKEKFLELVKHVSGKYFLDPIPLWVLFLIFFRQKKLNKVLTALLTTKKVRSWSGIVPVSIFTRNFGCPGRCVFCPTETKIPKSYFSDEPAVMRAIRNNYDAYRQVSSRLTQLFLSGHSIEKIELIIQGGTFSSINKKYREHFIKRAFDSANNEIENLLLGKNLRKAAKTLLKSQAINETAKQRIIGITVETRPDWINEDEVIFLRKLGVTRVEIGVQSLQNKVLESVKRGHGIKETREATKILKDAGLKICYHMMPGMPGSTVEKDLEDFKKLFSNPDFQPDLLKIYPCVVTKDSELLNWYKNGKFQPLDDDKLTKLLIGIKKIIPPYVRILRLVRDIPEQDIIAGSLISNLRQGVQKEMVKQGVRCKCIRCREVALKSNVQCKINNVQLRITRYMASGGIEFFLEYIDPKTETLFALLRLRFSSYLYDKSKPIFKELENSAIIRELHTYGLALPIGSKKHSPQHKGLGRKLLTKAEEIVKNEGFRKIAVTSGIGAREYYRKFGYKLQGEYMVKELI